MNDIHNNHEPHYLKPILIFVFVALWVMLFYRCHYGSVSNDEAFYITLGDRLYKGDALFLHEWHRAQLSGFIEKPLVFVYRMFFKTNDGIILNFRFLYTFVWGVVTIFVINRLKKFSYVGAYVAGIIMLLYAPFGIMALSYNVFSLMFLISSLIIIMTNYKEDKLEYVSSGILFSLAVLACPYLVAMYIVFVLYYFCIKKSFDSRFIYSFVGISITAVVFIAFVLSRISLSQVIDLIPQIINDNERVDHNIFLLPIEYVMTIINFNIYKKYIYTLLIIITAICLLDKKRKVHKDYYFIVSSFLVFVDLLTTHLDFRYINNLMYPLSMLGPIFLLYEDSRMKKLLKYIYFPGMMFSLILFASSDTGFHAISSGTLVADIAVVIMLIIVLEKYTGRKAIPLFIAILLLFQTGCELSARINNVFGSDSIRNQSFLIEKGIEKGLKVNEYKYEMYNSLYNEIESLSIPKNSKVLFLSRKSWLYLIDESYNYSTYSAWLAWNQEKLIPYFEINNNKIPDYIYADEDYFDIAYKLIELYKYKYKETEIGNLYCYK